MTWCHWMFFGFILRDSGSKIGQAASFDDYLCVCACCCVRNIFTVMLHAAESYINIQWQLLAIVDVLDRTSVWSFCVIHHVTFIFMKLAIVTALWMLDLRHHVGIKVDELIFFMSNVQSKGLSVLLFWRCLQCVIQTNFFKISKPMVHYDSAITCVETSLLKSYILTVALFIPCNVNVCL